MDASEILRELETVGSEGIKRILMNHGAQEPLFGVKVEELKKIQKRVKKDHELALALFETGNYDAQYLAGLIADESKMTATDLRHWLDISNSMPISSTIVPWVAAESNAGMQLAREWIASEDEKTANAGWHMLSSLVAVTPDSELDLSELKSLLDRVAREIHHGPNRVRYAMNGFVISLGSYVTALTEEAIETGRAIGPVSVDMGNTACQVPYSPDYIEKVRKRGSLGKKRKTARC